MLNYELRHLLRNYHSLVRNRWFRNVTFRERPEMNKFPRIRMNCASFKLMSTRRSRDSGYPVYSAGVYSFARFSNFVEEQMIAVESNDPPRIRQRERQAGNAKLKKLRCTSYIYTWLPTIPRATRAYIAKREYVHAVLSSRKDRQFCFSFFFFFFYLRLYSSDIKFFRARQNAAGIDSHSENKSKCLIARACPPILYARVVHTYIHNKINDSSVLHLVRSIESRIAEIGYDATSVCVRYTLYIRYTVKRILYSNIIRSVS